MTDISIVSGTYNRLAFLQKMVASVRASVAGYYGLSYEVVLVDGGSVDGTLDWIKAQPDCRLIEHGRLLGAVKAFNDGAYAAGGQYVILANDDIQFIDDSVYLAWRYMQDHPDCGVGCFYQDRGGRDFHIEDMPVIIDGKQAHAPYGQVAIVPKWLGDHVGWWCKPELYSAKGLPPLKTYGGDNELSARVYELGLKVSPISDARIHDAEAVDDLRKMNNIRDGKDPRAVKGHHPDSWAWGKMWRQPEKGGAGPVVVRAPVIRYPTLTRPRVVYLPIYEQGWAVQKEQKRGLREALARVGLVAEFDYVSRFHAVGKSVMLNELARLLQKAAPSLVLTQLHNGGNIDGGDIGRLRTVAPGAVWANWNGDYWPENTLSDDGIALARAFDLQTSVNRETVEVYRSMGINAAYWQIGWEPDGRGQLPDEKRRHDVVFLASGYSKARRQLVGHIHASGFNFGLYGPGWPEGWSSGNTLYNFAEGCKIYRAAKISVGDSQWPDSGFVSNRVMQALAAGGAALAHQWFRGMDELGLIDGQTCIVWSTLPELSDKVQYYLSHENERRRIAEAGERLAVERHSFDVRVKELWTMLGIGQPREAVAVEDWR